jgi:hypothetical protein
MSDLRIVMGFDFTDPPSAHPNGEPGFLLPGSDGIWAVGFRLARDSGTRTFRGASYRALGRPDAGASCYSSSPNIAGFTLGFRLVANGEEP